MNSIKDLHITRVDTINELATLMPPEKAEALVDNLLRQAIQTAIGVIPKTGPEVSLMAGELNTGEMRTTLAVLGGTKSLIEEIGRQFPSKEKTVFSQEVIKDDMAIRFGKHEIKTAKGTFTAKIYMDPSGYSPDLTVFFKNNEFRDTYHPSEDPVAIQSLNEILSQFGYNGKKLDRAEMGMQEVSKVVLEGGKDWTEWAESLGWKNLGKEISRRP